MPKFWNDFSFENMTFRSIIYPDIFQVKSKYFIICGHVNIKLLEVIE